MKKRRLFHLGIIRKLYFIDIQLNKLFNLYTNLLLMEKRKIGRPKKIHPIKAGQLKQNECRFTFITTLENVTEIKRRAKKDELTIKKYLNKVLKYYWSKNRFTSINENKMVLYLEKQSKK